MASKKSPYEVYPSAEKSLNTILEAFRAITLFCAALAALVGIFIAIAEEDWALLWIVVAAAGAALVAIVVWAIGKVLINISRNLYNINDALREEATVEKKGTKGEAVSKRETKIEEKQPLFKTGQEVRIKGSTITFCIDKIVEENGAFKYYSSRINSYYKEEDIEDNAKSKVTASSESKGPKYRIGQSVVIKRTMRKIQIDNVSEENGRFKYYSSAFDETFDEDELNA